ncbi:MAG: Gfo/Idh/MocA family oxidoreductase [Flavobacteriaceae bacterium]|nr:Gfo/Idh/MocA family oxidoreductase [Flavobacteriaceae bacterium]
MNRKTFIKNTAMMGAGGMFLPSLKGYALSQSANNISAKDQINIGTIGINGMGWGNTLKAIEVPGVNLVAVCDVDQNVIQKKLNHEAVAPIKDKIKVYSDYRKMLEQKDIDVVYIGTPDHWHALMMIEAAAAGKHIYVEKPIGNSIAECEAMVAAQKKYGSIIQVGQWQRSSTHFQDAMAFVHSGKLGPIRTVKVSCYQGWMRPQPKVANSAPPKGVDYDSWLGPAPKKPFNASRFHFHFRWFWDYAGGLMTDWGVHLLDYALIGMKASVPKSIVGLGGKFAYPDLSQETPDTVTTLYEFDKFNLVWDSAMGIDNGSYGRTHCIAFIGNNGTLVVDRSGWEVIEESKSKNKVLIPLQKKSNNGHSEHQFNFMQAIRENKQEILNCNVEAAAHVAKVAQMGNISFRANQKLNWSAEKNQFEDPKINKAYLAKEYFNGYQLPKID